MTARSIRRAAERKAAKLARKAAIQLATAAAAPSPATESPDHCEEISAAQLAANRANAQLSTGAKTPAGKAVSSLNALKNALTGRTVLLPTDDAAAYQGHLSAYQEDLQPVGRRESDLVQSIADCAWRLHRIAVLEMSIFAKGTVEFADSFNEHEVALRPRMIELETWLAYEKELRNLHIQEARLSRRREKEILELRELQKERRAKKEQALAAAAAEYVSATHRGQTPQLSANGFEFSTAEIERYLERVPPAILARWTAPAQRQPATTPEIAAEQAA
jgi:hypothetical protein